MKDIPLTQGKHAYVDDEDYAAASRYSWRWTPAGAATTIAGRPVLLHRFLLHPPDGTDVVFLNSKKSDCRRENMGLVDRGLAQWVDREAYGINSLLPVLQRLESTPLDFDATPTTAIEAVELRDAITESINLISSATNDKELTSALDQRSLKQWRHSMARLMNTRTAQRSAVKHALMRLYGDPEVMTDDERERKASGKQQRFKTFEARRLAAAAMLDDGDPRAMLLKAHVLLSKLNHEGRVSYTENERALLDAISDVLNEWEHERGRSASAETV